MRRALLAASACLSVLAASTALAQVDPARLVATVNGEEIRGAEYYRRMEYLPGVGKNFGGMVANFPPGFLTLEQLITEKLTLQLAKEKGVLPTDLDVTTEIANRMEVNPEYVNQWKAGGQTDDMLRHQVRLDLASFRLATQGFTVTDQEVESHYAQYGASEFTTPKRLTMRVIVVASDEAKKAVDADLASGKPFDAVAKARSIDVTSKLGGEYGTVPVTAFGAATQKVLGPLTKGQNSGWLETRSNDTVGWAKFRVEDVTPAKKLPLDKVLRREIRQKLLLGKAQGKVDLRAQMNDLRKRSAIVIAQPEFADPYKKFIEAYLKAEETGKKPGGN